MLGFEGEGPAWPTRRGSASRSGVCPQLRCGFAMGQTAFALPIGCWWMEDRSAPTARLGRSCPVRSWLMQVAIYTRVSTERQEREQTIESQLAVLRAWVEAQGHSVRDEHVFQDQGYSGARLDRPGLDRLRDAAQDGDVRGVVVLSPDRLARKYVYQVLLLEEFKRAGCQTLFVHRPIGEDPSDQLLLQIQGAIAEYER